MTDDELLNRVKLALNITGEYQDETLKIYIAEVKRFMLDGGVSEAIVNSEKSVGAIARGVSDLWSGAGGFTEYFVQSVVQLRYNGGEVSGNV